MVGTIDEGKLPIPIQDYVEAVTVCMQFNSFKLEDEEYLLSTLVWRWGHPQPSGCVLIS